MVVAAIILGITLVVLLVATFKYVWDSESNKEENNK